MTGTSMLCGERPPGELPTNPKATPKVFAIPPFSFSFRHEKPYDLPRQPLLSIGHSNRLYRNSHRWHLRLIRPKLALAHDGFDGVIVFFRRVFVLFEKPFDHLPHSGTCSFFLLPVNGAVLTQHFCQFPRQSNQGFIFVEILDVFRFGQCIVKSQFLFR